MLEHSEEDKKELLSKYKSIIALIAKVRVHKYNSSSLHIKRFLVSLLLKRITIDMANMVHSLDDKNLELVITAMRSRPQIPFPEYIIDSIELSTWNKEAEDDDDE